MKFLAFGDSLTAGYHRQGTAFAPWAPLLCRLLGATDCDHVGFSGFTTRQLIDCMDLKSTPDVVPRSWPGLRHKLRISGPYDVVLILAGTNDLADQVTPAQLVRNTSILHAAAHAAGAKTVCMSIPESHAATKVTWLRKLREESNAAIKAWALSQPREKVHYADVAQIVPWDDEATMAGLWEMDGLHMSAKGYEQFGRGLAPLIRDFVMGSHVMGPQAIGQAAAGSCGGGWSAGAKVRIHGLQNKPEYNGKVGRLGAVGAAGAMRCAVLLDERDGAPPLSVRRTNLELLEHPEGAGEGERPPAEQPHVR